MEKDDAYLSSTEGLCSTFEEMYASDDDYDDSSTDTVSVDKGKSRIKKVERLKKRRSSKKGSKKAGFVDQQDGFKIFAALENIDNEGTVAGDDWGWNWNSEIDVEGEQPTDVRGVDDGKKKSECKSDEGEKIVESRETLDTSEKDGTEEIITAVKGEEQNETDQGLFGGLGSLVFKAGYSLQSLGQIIGNRVATAVETVESSLGVVSPEEMARRNKECENHPVSGEQEKQENPTGADICPSGGVVGDLFKNLKNTSMNLVDSSLGALECLGQKTYEVLTERDDTTGRRKLKFERSEPTLSEILQELRETSDKEAPLQDMTPPPVEEFTFNGLKFFTEKLDEKGINHVMKKLDFFKMIALRKIDSMKMNLPPERLTSVTKSLDKYEEQFLETEESFSDGLLEKQADVNQEDSSDSDFDVTQFELNIQLPITYTTKLKIDSIKNSHRRCCDLIAYLKNENSAELGEVVQMTESGLEALADFTFHCANCWLELIQSLNTAKPPPFATTLANIVSGMCMEVQTFVADLTGEILKCTTQEVEAQVCATEVFLQANKSCSLIHEAYNFVLPYMQWLQFKNVLN
ncbi:Uncharacterized protein T11_17479 [Trichinella zimbabwensis]|uniref:Protein FAM114A2 n=1 Tax=Trichinella zimbabwensis TaxID=268475 RepID=A0A0V1I940_9BILA|nr:Uncharacterized protein T11_17479 [Trichinella zimbabwensis]